MKGEATVVTLDLNDVLPNRFQPRIKFNENKIGELAESIRKYGVIQPIIVRKIGDKYEIIAGERRYKASVLAGQTHIPAIINNLDDKDSSEVALIENVQREDLTPIEEAISYKKILDMGYLTQENLASKLGLSQSAVANKLRLLNLSDAVQEALLENKISERHARSLLKIKKEEEQIRMLNRIVKERLTVRKTDEEIEKLLHKEEKNKIVSKPNPSEEEIEILNILNTYKEEKEKKKNMNEEKEDTEMNPNDPMNQFDIPEVSIMNDTPSPEVKVNPSISEMPKGSAEEPMVFPNVGIPSLEPNPSPVIEDATNTVTPSPNPSNPGFMDIDRIQREAADITQIDPLAPMDQLLSSEAPSPLNAPEIPVQPKGKFFDVMPSIQNQQTETESAEPSIFGNPSSLLVNHNVSTPSSEPTTADSTDNFSSILMDPIIQPINVPTPPPSAAPSPEVVSPLPTTPTPVQNAEPTISFPSVDPISMVPSPEPVMESLVSPIENVSSIEVQPVEIPEVKLGSTPDIPSIEPIEVPTPPISSFESESLVAPIPSSIPSEPISPISMPESITPLPSAVSAPPENIRKAISIIRNAVDELDRLGFRVDTDELDLENIYQVIIKINK